MFQPYFNQFINGLVSNSLQFLIAKHKLEIIDNKIIMNMVYKKFRNEIV